MGFLNGNNTLEELTFGATNNLISVNLYNIPNLKFIYILNSYFDLSATSSITINNLLNLQEITCSSSSQLTSLNLNNLTALTNLYVTNNNLLTVLNMNGLTNFYYLTCVSNQISTLNLNSCVNLNYIKCQNT